MHVVQNQAFENLLLSTWEAKSIDGLHNASTVKPSRYYTVLYQVGSNADGMG